MISAKFKNLLIKILATCKNRGFADTGIFLIEKFIEEDQITVSEAEEIMRDYKQQKNKIEHDKEFGKVLDFKKKWEYDIYFEISMKSEKNCADCKRRMAVGTPGCQRRNSEWVHVMCVKDSESNNPYYNAYMKKTLKMV